MSNRPFLLALALVAGPAYAEAGERAIVILDMKTDAEGVKRSTLQAFTDIVASHIEGAAGYQPITAADISAVIDLGAQASQLLGCEEGFCLEEYAGALGADIVVFSRYEIVAAEHLIKLRLVDIETGKALAQQQLESDDPGAMVDTLPEVVDRLLSQLEGKAIEGDTVRARYNNRGDVARSALTFGAVSAAAAVGTFVAMGATLVVSDDDATRRLVFIGLGLLFPALSSVVASAAFNNGVGVAVTSVTGGVMTAGFFAAFAYGFADEAPIEVWLALGAAVGAGMTGYMSMMLLVPHDDTLYFETE